MTIEESIREHLDGFALAPSIISGIIEEAKESELLEPIRNGWKESAGEYPHQVLVLVKMSVDNIALEWLKKNSPKHFVIPYLEKLVNPNKEVKNES